MPKFLINCNSNIVCAINCEVTGPIPGEDDLIQICVLALDSKLEPNKDIVPFDVCLQPKRPENFPLNSHMRKGRPSKERFLEASVKGLEPYVAADLFDDWFKKLELANGKSIIPLCHNWPFFYQFICDWLGYHSANQYFNYRFRDTQATAVYLNDCAEFHVEPLPHPKMDLSYLASIYRIPHERKRDTLAYCIVIAEVYRTIIKRSLFHLKLQNLPKIIPEELNDSRSQHLIDENQKCAIENYKKDSLSFHLANLGYKPESDEDAVKILQHLVLENEWYQRNI